MLILGRLPRHALREYRKKRDFRKTPEPSGKGAGRRRRLTFVVQEHHARRLHWDFRLEHGGVLKSWAITREPSPDPKNRALAIETEDHPREYARFRGVIPRGQYGAGTVKIWDRGTYGTLRPLTESLVQGVLEITLRGKKLKGRFFLVRMSGEGRKSRWLFFKAKPKVIALRVA